MIIVIKSLENISVLRYNKSSRICSENTGIMQFWRDVWRNIDEENFEMLDMNHRFDVQIKEEKKVDKNLMITFEITIKGEQNCRIKIEGCQGFDVEGYKYEISGEKMSVIDVIIGSSRFFKDSQKININMGDQFKSRNGSAIVLMVKDLDSKTDMKICFQKKGATRWDMVGIQAA